MVSSQEGPTAEKLIVHEVERHQLGGSLGPTAATCMQLGSEAQKSSLNGNKLVSISAKIPP